jgi:hypothetical protein
MNVARLIRDAAKTEADRDELAYAMREIERVKIMDGISAIRMRAIAKATLKKVKCEPAE